MNKQTNDFEVAIKALAHAQLSEPHPDAEDLIDYQRGRLSRENIDRIADHLALCQECADTVLDLAAFPDIPTRRGESCSQHEARRAWKKVQAQITPNPWHGWSKIAAGLVMVVLLETIWLSYLSREIGQLSQPQGDVFVENISSGVTRSLDQSLVTEVPPGMNRVVWVLNPGLGYPEYPRYEARIVALSEPEKTVWQGELKRLPEENFTLQVSRNSVPAGNYRIELLGVNGEKQVLATFSRHLRYSDP